MGQKVRDVVVDVIVGGLYDILSCPEKVESKGEELQELGFPPQTPKEKVIVTETAAPQTLNPCHCLLCD